MSAPAVTVAVVSWNTRDLLERCLESLRPEAERGVAEVWVVDNASTDGSPELVGQRYGWVRLIASKENLGFGRAVNLVANQTSSEWIATANADVAMHSGALDELLAAGARDPGAGAIAPRLLLPNGETQYSINPFPTIAYSVYRLLTVTPAWRLDRRLPDWATFSHPSDTERARRVPWAIAAFLMVRRRAWTEIGGFDERQWMYAEDTDFGWRLRRAGWATRYEPAAHVEHESAASTTQFFGDERRLRWQRATYCFIARRRGMANLRVVALLNVLGAVARWARVAPRSLRDPTGYREERRHHARDIGVHVEALRATRARLEARS